MNIEFIDKVFRDVDGEPSSKRIIVFICVIVLSIMALIEQIFGCKIDIKIFDIFKHIIIIGLGIIGSEKFTNRPVKKEGEASPS